MAEPVVRHHYPEGLPESMRETWDQLESIPLADRALSRILLQGRAKRELEVAAELAAMAERLAEAERARDEALARAVELEAEIAVDEDRLAEALCEMEAMRRGVQADRFDGLDGRLAKVESQVAALVNEAVADRAENGDELAALLSGKNPVFVAVRRDALPELDPLEKTASLIEHSMSAPGIDERSAETLGLLQVARFLRACAEKLRG